MGKLVKDKNLIEKRLKDKQERVAQYQAVPQSKLDAYAKETKRLRSQRRILLGCLLLLIISNAALAGLAIQADVIDLAAIKAKIIQLGE